MGVGIVGIKSHRLFQAFDGFRKTVCLRECVAKIAKCSDKVRLPSKSRLELTDRFRQAAHLHHCGAEIVMSVSSGIELQGVLELLGGFHKSVRLNKGDAQV